MCALVQTPFPLKTQPALPKQRVPLPCSGFAPNLSSLPWGNPLNVLLRFSHPYFPVMNCIIFFIPSSRLALLSPPFMGVKRGAKKSLVWLRRVSQTLFVCVPTCAFREARRVIERSQRRKNY